MKKLVVFILILFCGCDSAATIRNRNQTTLNSGGEVIGTLPDGRVITRYEIKCYSDNHWVYVVGNSSTNSYSTSNGDKSISHVEVLFDNGNFYPKNPTNAEVIVNGIKYYPAESN